MGLTQKILLFTGLMIVALAGTTLAFTTVQADRLARTTIQEALADTRTVWESFQADRFANLKARLGALANDPYLKPLVEAAVEQGEGSSLADTLKERAADIRPDLFLATDPGGVVVARADGQEAGQDLSGDPLVSGALEQGKPAGTLWRQGSRLYHAVSAPMVTGEDTKGVLVAGYEVNQALAEQLRKLTHCEIAFVSEGQGEGPLLAASSLGAQAGLLLPALSTAASAGEMAPFNLDLGGERYIAVQAPLKDVSGRVLGRVVALRSLAREMAGFLQFRNSLVIVSLGVMAVALLLATLGARRITGPVRTLVGLVERARDGSYSGAVAVHTGDEIGVLARAFNGLLAELREKEQLIQYLNEGMTQMKRAEAQPTLSASDETAAIKAVSAQAGVQVEKGQLFAGRYEVLGTLGKGGMGIVYRAEDKRLDEVVALKVLRPEVLENDPTLLQRFKEELRLARRITHKNVLRTHDFDVTQDGTPYISMEYLEGVTLKELVQGKGALPVGVGLRIAKQMCAGLNAAHQQGVVHRDIKPHNMLIIPETGELKIMDFGIARRSEVHSDGGLTTDGMVMGTPDYMAPEQAQGHPADFRSDLYALGVVLFEVFTGRLPFQGETVMATVLKHIQEPAPDPRQANPRLPEDLARLILRCLAKDPAARFQRAGDIHKELTAVSSRQAGPAAAA